MDSFHKFRLATEHQRLLLKGYALSARIIRFLRHYYVPSVWFIPCNYRKLPSLRMYSIVMYYIGGVLHSAELDRISIFQCFLGDCWNRLNSFNIYHGNIKPPKQASTCKGIPLDKANSAISSTGSMIPWANCGADATNITVFSFIAYKDNYIL